MSDSFILRKNNSNLKLKEMSYVICRNQGIITDIPVNKDYKIEVKFDAEDFNQESIFGITIDNSVYTHFTLYSNKYYFGTGSSEFSFGSYVKGDHIFIYNDENSQCIFDGEVISNISVSDQSGYYYTIGCRANNTNFVYYGKLYYIKMTDKNTNTLAHYLVPVNQTVSFSNKYNTSMPISGIIDLITGKIYQNEKWDIIEKPEDDTLWSRYNFIADTAGTIFVYGGRTVTKLTDDKAYCAYCWNDGWFIPILVGLNNESTKFDMYGNTSSALSPTYESSGGTLEKYDKLWYYNFSSPGSYSGNVIDSSRLNRYCFGEASDNVLVFVNQLIDICSVDFL